MYCEDERSVPEWVQHQDCKVSQPIQVFCPEQLDSSCDEEWVYDDTHHPLPVCIFDPTDAWFGRSFVGDGEYKIWYAEYTESMIEAQVCNNEDIEEYSDEEYVGDEFL